MNKELDLLAIGDTVVDAFIKLKEAHVTCKVDHQACEICMAFGAKVPYESVTVLPYTQDWILFEEMKARGYIERLKTEL